MMADEQKSWEELADMKIGKLILEGGDRTWPEILRRVDEIRLNREGQR